MTLITQVYENIHFSAATLYFFLNYYLHVTIHSIQYGLLLFIYYMCLTHASSMPGGNQAVPGGHPQLSAGCWRTFESTVLYKGDISLHEEVTLNFINQHCVETLR